ncbi:MAG: hypothetical protein ACYDCL_18815 [Myxococcales bacterium]
MSSRKKRQSFFHIKRDTTEGAANWGARMYAQGGYKIIAATFSAATVAEMYFAQNLDQIDDAFFASIDQLGEALSTTVLP